MQQQQLDFQYNLKENFVGWHPIKVAAQRYLHGNLCVKVVVAFLNPITQPNFGLFSSITHAAATSYI
jgi:hypothetical protein